MGDWPGTAGLGAGLGAVVGIAQQPLLSRLLRRREYEHLFSKLFSGSAAALGICIGAVADRYIQSPDEKGTFVLDIGQLLQRRVSKIE